MMTKRRLTLLTLRKRMRKNHRAAQTVMMTMMTTKMTMTMMMKMTTTMMTSQILLVAQQVTAAKRTRTSRIYYGDWAVQDTPPLIPLKEKLTHPPG
uniref:Uncharacterized protein n=1 Tax=Anguilla anguilla TaxID=7936 RepID=A0A0E9WB63_ANGAN